MVYHGLLGYAFMARILWKIILRRIKVKLLKLIMPLGLVLSTAVWAQVNINMASLEQLQALPGIGPVKAKAIVDYRNTHGKFKSIGDLRYINGIGQKIIENLGTDATTSGVTNIDNLSNQKQSVKPMSKKPGDKKS